MSSRAPYPHEEVASFLAHVCNQIGTGRMGGMSTAILFAHGDGGHPAIVLTYPVQPVDQTIAELEAALEWLRGPAGERLRMKLGTAPGADTATISVALPQEGTPS